MKRVFILGGIFIGILVLFAVVACGNNTSPNTPIPELRPVPTLVPAEAPTEHQGQDIEVTPFLPSAATPENITLVVPPGTEITLNFWDTTGRYHLAGSFTQFAGQEGVVEFDGERVVRPLLKGIPSEGDYPINVRADISLSKGGSLLHFRADLDVSQGGLFWIDDKEENLVINMAKTSFYPLVSPGPSPASLQESMKASIAILTDDGK